MKSGRALVLLCCVAVVLAGCGIGAPWPHSDGTAWHATSGHRDILLFGDSLMGQMSPALPAVLAAHNMDATVADAHANGSGLVGTINGQDPLAFVTAQLDAHPETDIVVFQWSGMCTRPCPISYGSDAFYAAWFAKAEQIVQLARARGLTVVWTIAPPPPPVSASPGSPYDFNEATASALSWRSRGLIVADSLAYADWWKALAGVDDFLGHWDLQLFYDGAVRNVRAGDLVQLTPDGARRAATWTASSLADHWNDTAPHAPAPGGVAADPVVVSTDNGPKAIDFPDPFVFRPSGADSPWYGYATGAGFVDLQMISSTDLVNWTLLGDPLPGGSNGWADLFSFSWAPSVIERPDNPPEQRFVMYYTAHDRASGSQCVGRATSASAEGPFADERTSPLICQPGGSIDPSPFVAADGNPWLVFSNTSGTTSIWSVRLSPDGRSLASGSTKLLTTASGSWEGPLIEAPTMIASPSGVELFYSANPFDTPSYSVGVARCDGPSGPCSRIYSTPLLATRSTMAGPGGQTPFQDADGNWAVAFHAWTSPKIGYPAGLRTLRFLPMTFPGGLPKIG